MDEDIWKKQGYVAELDQCDVRDEISTLSVAESRAGEDEGTLIQCRCDGSVLVPSS